MIILGIETSCDETAAAVLEEKNGKLSVLSNIVSSQVKLHSAWGGVVPNLAAREHLKNIIPVLENSLKKAGISPKKIELISVTNGPGLIPALLIGVNAAKAFSYLWKKPLIGIHHIEGHIYANFISSKTGVNSKFQISSTKQPKSYNLKTKGSNIRFPILCLVVSGGHTQLILIKKHLQYKIVGQTLDDAAGEAFDKVARILNLGYPGGPAIAKMAMGFPISLPRRQAGKSQFPNNFKFQNSKFKIHLPRPMINSNNHNFSFSGLKTAVLYTVKKDKKLLRDKDFIAQMCHEFQQAVIDVLISKTLSAAKIYKPKTILLAGGVSANLELRKQMIRDIGNDLKNILCVMPDTLYSIDNAAMIAAAGYFRYQASKNRKALLNNWKNLEADANLVLR